LQRESQFNVDELGTFVETNLSKLVSRERVAYNRIMRAIKNQRGENYFIDTPGGIDKTFLISFT